MTKKDLVGLTVAQIKAQYPKGQYKSSMKKADVIDTALKSVKTPATHRGNASRTELGR